MAPTATCDLAVVGAGVGGAYSALRAAATGRKVCVFERAPRPGGRIHSLRGQGAKGDLVVEAGAYRFAKEAIVQKIGNITSKFDTPLTAAIVEELGLPNKRYNPNTTAWDHGLFKLVDVEGENAGYLTLVEKLLEVAISKGAEVRFDAQVVRLDDVDESGCIVQLKSGEQIRANSIVLNLPQKPLIEMLRRSGGAFLSVFPRPLYVPVVSEIVKLYVHYDDAWWINDLGLSNGSFHNTGPLPAVPSFYSDTPLEKPAPLQGSYHDGHVRCDLPDGRCRGYLQAYYGGNHAGTAGSLQGAEYFYAPFVDSIANDSVVQVGRDQPDHVELLDLVHDALLELHRPALSAVGLADKVAAVRPSSAVLSIWRTGVEGIQGGCHQPKFYPNGQPRVPGELSQQSLKPFANWPIYVANEAFGPMGCWAEGSLAMAEMAMRSILGADATNTLTGGEGNEWPPRALAGSLFDPKMVAGRLHTDPSLLGLHMTESSAGEEAPIDLTSLVV